MVFKNLWKSASFLNDVFDIEENQIPATIDYLKKYGYTGFNVTTPYKEIICKYIDTVDGEFYWQGMIYVNFDLCCRSYDLPASRVMNYAVRNGLTREESLKHFIEGAKKIKCGRA